MYNEIQEIMNNHGIFDDREMEEALYAVSSVLEAIADNIRKNEPYAWKTIEEFEAAARMCRYAVDYLEEE